MCVNTIFPNTKTPKLVICVFPSHKNIFWRTPQNEKISKILSKLQFSPYFFFSPDNCLTVVLKVYICVFGCGRVYKYKYREVLLFRYLFLIVFSVRLREGQKLAHLFSRGCCECLWWYYLGASYYIFNKATKIFRTVNQPTKII